MTFFLPSPSRPGKSPGLTTGREVSTDDDQTGQSGCPAVADLQAAVSGLGRFWSSREAGTGPLHPNVARNRVPERRITLERTTRPTTQ